MRHIRREAFIRVDPRPERAGRRLQVARQHADLILSRQQRGRHAAGAAFAFAHRGGGFGQLQNRRGQRARQVERGEHREQQRQPEQREHRDADFQQPRIHFPRLARQQHQADGRGTPPRGFGDGDQQPPFRRAADIGADARFQRLPQFLPPVAGAGDAEFRLPVEGWRIGVHIHQDLRPRAARQDGEDAVIEACDRASECAARLGRGERFGGDGAARPFAHPAVRDQQAGGVEQPRLGVGGGFGQAAQQRAGRFGHQDGAVVARAGRGFADGARVDARLGAERFDLRRQQSVLVLVEIQKRRRQQRRRKRIEQQDAPQQRRQPAPPPCLGPHLHQRCTARVRHPDPAPCPIILARRPGRGHGLAGQAAAGGG